MKATIDEDVRSVRADPSTATPSAPTLDVLTTSAQEVEEDDIVPFTGPGTQLQAYSSEFVGLMRSWSRLLNQASVFDGQLMVSKSTLSFPAIDIF